MATSSMSIPISDVTHRITLQVSGLRGFTVRLIVARWLIVLAARVARVNPNVEFVEE
jgi:hypothetical protein